MCRCVTLDVTERINKPKWSHVAHKQEDLKLEEATEKDHSERFKENPSKDDPQTLIQYLILLKQM